MSADRRRRRRADTATPRATPFAPGGRRAPPAPAAASTASASAAAGDPAMSPLEARRKRKPRFVL
jgi:hypothetical protein